VYSTWGRKSQSRWVLLMLPQDSEVGGQNARLHYLHRGQNFHACAASFSTSDAFSPLYVIVEEIGVGRLQLSVSLRVCPVFLSAFSASSARPGFFQRGERKAATQHHRSCINRCTTPGNWAKP
jgi:hypothetical protein